MASPTKSDQRYTNRLINETSTYLLQHAHNPVDWYPWGPEALSVAKDKSKPILLSVGYSACHWCHVMEHESFEDDATAKLMNELFVCIKVDREERPDIDEIYMKAVQMLTGHGGWPMTVFLTPDLKPFFAGTYFPPEERQGMPSFKKVLTSVNTAWQEQRENVINSADEITSHLAVFEKVPDNRAQLGHALIDSALKKLWQAFDRDFGGFGSAPKFPHPSCLSLIMQHAASHEDWEGSLKDECTEMLTKTLDEMGCGGMYDQLGGGFARYSVDRTWLIPHFEKMLYDNAQLCRNYLQGYQITGEKHWAQVGQEILEFVLREMTTPEGAFYSSLDADSEGEEGKFYVWKPEEIGAVLGPEDGAWFCKIYGVTHGGNFENDTSVLRLVDTPIGWANQHAISVEQFWERLNPMRQKMLEAREKRVRPGRDEKVLLSWNALMISAFVDGYRILAEPTYLAVAHRAADFIWENMRRNERLLRTWGRGQAKLQGYLDDYAYYVQALLDLASVDFDSKWLERALQLTDLMLEQFTDERDGSLYYTSKEHEALIAKTKSFYDASIPSPTAVATLNLLRLATMFDEKNYRQRAEKILEVYAAFFDKVPDQFASFLCALEFSLRQPTEIVFVADADADGWQDMLLTIHSGFIPNAVIMLKDASAETHKMAHVSPLLEDRDLIDGHSAVYICQNYRCEQPITAMDDLLAEIARLSVQAT